MMGTHQQSIQSPMRYYKWSYTHGNIPSSIVCIASSLIYARNQIWSNLTQIEDMSDDRERVEDELYALDDRVDKSISILPDIQRLNEYLRQKLPPIEDNTGCYCPRVIDYSRNMNVTYYYTDNTSLEMTLGDLILTIDPIVREIPLVIFTSCLDG